MRSARLFPALLGLALPAGAHASAIDAATAAPPTRAIVAKAGAWRVDGRTAIGRISLASDAQDLRAGPATTADTIPSDCLSCPSLTTCYPTQARPAARSSS